MEDKTSIMKELAFGIGLAGTVAEWSRKHNISPQYVHDVLSDRRDPGKKILDALGYELVKGYVRKETK